MSGQAPSSLLPTTCCLLPTAYYLLPTTDYDLLTYSLPTATYYLLGERAPAAGAGGDAAVRCLRMLATLTLAHAQAGNELG